MQAKFEGSAEAQAHMDAITNLLADPRLTDWLKATDADWYVNTLRLHATAKEAIADIQEIVDNCC